MAAHSSAETQGTERYQARFRGLVITQLVLAAVGAVALVTIAVAVSSKLERLGELEAKKHGAQAELRSIVDAKQVKEAELQQLRAEYQKLKRNTEQMYAVNVTRDNQVYAVKASARATGDKGPRGPIYDFKAYIEAPDEALAEIEKVVYRFDHDTFRQPVVEATDPDDRFQVGYRGWGCLTDVAVTVHLKNGETRSFDFNMCKSIGWQ